MFTGEEQLKAILAHVTGPTDIVRHALPLEPKDAIARGWNDVPKESLEPIGCLWSLHGKAREGGALILQRHRRIEVLTQPGVILFDLGGVHNEQPIDVSDAVNDQVIDYSAALIQHERVLPLPDGEA